MKLGLRDPRNVFGGSQVLLGWVRGPSSGSWTLGAVPMHVNGATEVWRWPCRLVCKEGLGSRIGPEGHGPEGHGGEEGVCRGPPDK